MLVRRKIELRAEAAGLPSVLITHKELIDCGQAQCTLTRAREMAKALLSTAQTESDARLEAALQTFWERANTQLKCWQTEHQAQREEIESNATAVVNQALHHLLGDVPPPARIAALLEQLLRTQCPPLDATLRCHSHAHAHIRQWLNAQTDTVWQLQIDERLDTQALVLATELGDFCIDWRSTAGLLLLPEATEGTDQQMPATH